MLEHLSGSNRNAIGLRRDPVPLAHTHNGDVRPRLTALGGVSLLVQTVGDLLISRAPRSHFRDSVLQIGIGGVSLAANCLTGSRSALLAGLLRQIPAFWSRGSQLSSTGLVGCEGNPGTLADLRCLMLRHGGQYVDREAVGVGIVAGDKIDAEPDPIEAQAPVRRHPPGVPERLAENV